MIRPAQQILLELERECLAVDAAIAARAWSACDISWRKQRRLTHELEFALRELVPKSPESVAAARRIERLQRYRDGQLKKLEAYHAAVGKRLQALGKFRSYAKSTQVERPARWLDTSS